MIKNTRQCKKVKLYPNKDGFSDRLQQVFDDFDDFKKYVVEGYMTEAPWKWALEIDDKLRTPEEAWALNKFVEFEFSKETDVSNMQYAKTYIIHNNVRVDVLNPGDNYCQHLWLIAVQGGFEADLFVVDADNGSDALDEFVDSKYGHLIQIEDHERKDYKGRDVVVGDTLRDGTIAEVDGITDLNDDFVHDSRRLQEPNYLGNSGIPCDLDHVSFYEVSNAALMFGVTLPECGVRQKDYSAYVDAEEDVVTLYDEMTRTGNDLPSKLDIISNMLANICAEHTSKRDELHDRMYGAHTHRIASLLCRLVYPGADVLKKLSNDDVFTAARALIGDATALHSPGIQVTTERVTIDGADHEAVVYGKWNGDTKSVTQSQTTTGFSIMECVTVEHEIKRRGWVTTWLRVDGCDVYRSVITETKPVTK
jgi:hypothetical protein